MVHIATMQQAACTAARDGSAARPLRRRAVPTAMWGCSRKRVLRLPAAFFCHPTAADIIICDFPADSRLGAAMDAGSQEKRSRRPTCRPGWSCACCEPLPLEKMDRVGLHQTSRPILQGRSLRTHSHLSLISGHRGAAGAAARRRPEALAPGFPTSLSFGFRSHVLRPRSGPMFASSAKDMLASTSEGDNLAIDFDNSSDKVRDPSRSTTPKQRSFGQHIQALAAALRWRFFVPRCCSQRHSTGAHCPAPCCSLLAAAAAGMHCDNSGGQGPGAAADEPDRRL